jgi:dihydrofolate reductase
MAKLTYVSNVSLDGCTEGELGGANWAEPDDEVFAFTTELMRSAGVYLYGRRMYETMAVWETDAALATASEARGEFAAVWGAAEKVVYSTTLARASTTRTTLERRFDPDAVRARKASSAVDLLVGGPHLAAEALRAGLVDECHLLVWPVVLGGRNPALPGDLHLDLTLLEERSFPNGVVHLRYRVGSVRPVGEDEDRGVGGARPVG